MKVAGSRHACHSVTTGAVHTVSAGFDRARRLLADGTGEAAIEEFGAGRNPAVDVRAGKAAPLEASLPGTHEAEVRALEAAFAENALPPAREERLQPLVEVLATEVAPLEDATIRGEALEGSAAEVRIADRHSIQRQHALHVRPPEALGLSSSPRLPPLAA